MKINYAQLFLKAHYFLFYGSLGSIFPFVLVYGKQLGISPLSIGSIYAFAPIACLITKPIFGFILDYFRAWRKVIFFALFLTANICFSCIFLLPAMPGPKLFQHHFQNVSCETLSLCDMEYASAIKSCNGAKETTCHWVCENTTFSTQLSFHADLKKAIISSDTACLLNINETSPCLRNVTNNYNCNVTCDNFKDDQCMYTSLTFWSYCFLLCLGEIASYTFICISDSFCFAILGEILFLTTLGTSGQDKQLEYGTQRMWGSIGYGSAAGLAGYLIDLWSQDEVTKIYTPALILVLVYACCDLICIYTKMELPRKPKSTTILKDVFTLLKLKSVLIFLCFVICTGMFTGILHNYLFWYAEDLAIATGYMGKIKLIEGLIVIMQAFSEVLFFFLSGKILKKLGYVYTLTFCFICYALRLGLTCLAPTPWWIVVIEIFTSGSSFALSLTTLLSYASVVAPPGALATVQGFVRGVNNGLGLSIGSLIGGIIYKKLGGKMVLKIFSVFAALSALICFILHTFYLKDKTDGQSNIKWRNPDDAHESCVVADT